MILIRDRFVEFYKKLHEPDEKGFNAHLAPEGPGLMFEVDYFDHGHQPPNALHSEGHQDSMGICLYLSLVERLTSGVLDIIVLDDVMMSVDADHRRQLCKVLSNYFPNHQFIITTHDKTWASQLRSEGVVNSHDLLEFFTIWSLMTGPRVNNEIDIWSSIEKDLQINDVPSAAARLRRGSEAFFSLVCDLLQAHVRYRQDGRWELGELTPSAYTRYKELLKKAKRSSQSWGQNIEQDMLQDLDEIASQIYNLTNAEQWGINVSYSLQQLG